MEEEGRMAKTASQPKHRVWTTWKDTAERNIEAGPKVHK